jgi:hypothetical protein
VVGKQLAIFDTIYCTVIVNDAFKMHCQLGNYVLQVTVSDSYGLSGSGAAVEVYVFQIKSLRDKICILSLPSNHGYEIMYDKKVR